MASNALIGTEIGEQIRGQHTCSFVTLLRTKRCALVCRCAGTPPEARRGMETLWWRSCGKIRSLRDPRQAQQKANNIGEALWPMPPTWIFVHFRGFRNNPFCPFLGNRNRKKIYFVSRFPPRHFGTKKI